MIISFADDEESIFQQTLEYFSKNLSYVPNNITEKKFDFSIDPFTRTFIDKSGNSNS